MKNKKKQLAGNILLTLVIGMYHSVPAFALPSQGTLDNSNAASISTQGTTMSITGKGANNILNWATFSIDKGETVKFTDKSNYLNLVRGVDISRIYGTMSGGGTVYLVNPNGILFGQGARLDNVGSFIASTRNISAINQDEFLKNPNDTTAVLGTDSKEMDNKDYYPEYLSTSFVPKISVASIELTNVPQSATTIILDGPGGVILKSAELLGKTTQVVTRKEGGEIGIGSGSEQVALTAPQKEKIGLIEGNKVVPLSDNPNVLQGYKIIRNMAEFQNQNGTYYSNSPSHYMLVNDIDASNVSNHNPVNASGVFEGMGYEIANLSMSADTDYNNSSGLFGEYSGEIRNLKLHNINFSTEENDGRTSSIGGLVGGFTSGTISNVSVSGEIEGAYNVGGIVGTLQGLSEIRNSTNEANITLSYIDSSKRLQPFSLGGIVGTAYNFTGLLTNVTNKGEIKTKPGMDQWGGNVAGIVGKAEGIGTASSNGTLRIRGAFNKGLVSGDNSSSWLKEINVGGVIGFNDATNASIGETYNLGIVETRSSIEKTSIGGIVGNDKKGVLVGVSNETGKQLYSYYENEKVNNKTDYGVGITTSEMAEKFKPEMFGIYNTANFNSSSTGTPINVEKPDAPSVVPGGNTGGNDGGSTGGNTDGNTGGNDGGGTVVPKPVVPSVMPGGNTGRNDTGSTTGNTGGNTGGNDGGGTVVPKPVVPSVMPGGNSGGDDTGSTGGNTGRKSDKTPSWHFEYKDTTLDAGWKLIENGIIPQGYEGEITVVMDPNNSERSQVYIKRTDSEIQNIKKQQLVEKEFTGIQMPPYYQLNELKKEYYQSVLKSFNQTKTTSDLQKEYMKGNIGSYIESLVQVETENKKDKIPASVYSAFLDPVYKSVNARIDSISTKEMDLVTLVKNSGNLISNWLPSSYNTNRVVKDETGKSIGKIKYEYALGQNFKADVTWTDSEGNHKATMSVNLYGTKESDKMIKNFMADLSDIGQDAVNNAVDELILLGFDKSKEAKKALDFVHKFTDALVDDAQAEALAGEIGGNFQEAVKGEGILFFKKTVQEKLENLVTSKINNGDKLIAGIKKIKEAEQKLIDYQSKYSQMSKNIDNYTNGNSTEQLEASYRILQTSLNELKGLSKF